MILPPNRGDKTQQSGFKFKQISAVQKHLLKMVQIKTALILIAAALCSVVFADDERGRPGLPGRPGGSGGDDDDRGRPGLPGRPGGSGGGHGGNAGSGGGGGGGNGGGGGGFGGAPGLPGGSDDSDPSIADYDFAFSLEDFGPLYDEDEIRSAPVGPPKSLKIKKIPKACEDVKGVKEYVESKSPKTKKNWIAFILKVSTDGNKPCAQALAKLLVNPNEAKKSEK